MAHGTDARFGLLVLLELAQGARRAETDESPMILLKLTPLEGGMVEVRPSGFDPAVRDQFRTVPGARWDRDIRAYIAPEEALESVLNTLEKAKVARVIRPQRGGKRDERVNYAAPSITATLRPYQNDGIYFLTGTLHAYSAAILADEMGLGKTVQAILATTLRRTAAKPAAIVVCPAIVATHWADEIQKWGGEPSLVWTGKKKPKVALAEAFDHVRWLVLSYDMFRRLQSELPIAQTLILDELHYLGHARSQRSKAVREYLSRIGRKHLGSGAPATDVIGLTGTPITAWLQALHNPLDLLFPGRFGSWFQFSARYCGGRFEDIVAKNGRPVLDAEGLPRRAWKADGVSNLDELRARLKPFMLRRTKQDSGIQLPPRIRTTIPVDLPAEARRELRSITSLVRSPDELRRALVGVEAYKLDAAVELAGELTSAGQRVLLFTCRRSHARTLGERLSCPAVTGEDDATERKKLLLSGGNVAVATMFSVTTGIDLTHFDSAIFVGLDWVPSNLLQAEARLHRPGQKKTVNVYFLIGRPSIDEHIRKVVVDRLETFSNVLGAESTANERGLANDLEDRSDLIGQIVKLVEEST